MLTPQQTSLLLRAAGEGGLTSFMFPPPTVRSALLGNFDRLKLLAGDPDGSWEPMLCVILVGCGPYPSDGVSALLFM